MDNAQTVPAERLRSGRALQRVNQFDRDGRFVRQLAWVGTVEEVRARAALEYAHDTDPDFAALYAAATGR